LHGRENGTTFKRERGDQNLDISKLDEIPDDISDIIFKGGDTHPATWIRCKMHLKMGGTYHCFWQEQWRYALAI
jgi:hypothetical protein